MKIFPFRFNFLFFFTRLSIEAPPSSITIYHHIQETNRISYSKVTKYIHNLLLFAASCQIAQYPSLRSMYMITISKSELV